MDRFGWRSALAMTGCGLWLIAAALDWRWATVVIIVLSAFALVSALATGPARGNARDQMLIVAPLAMLAGWLTIASALNILTVLTAEGFISEAAAPFFAGAGVAAVAAIGLFVFERCREPFFLAPMSWGLLGVFVAELGHRPYVAWIALGAGLILLLRAGADLATRSAA
jgi:putative Ca2+/H+ antiporter (TMEM165/GDT1 family)